MFDMCLELFCYVGVSPELRRLISWMMDPLPQQRFVAFLCRILVLFRVDEQGLKKKKKSSELPLKLYNVLALDKSVHGKTSLADIFA